MLNKFYTIYNCLNPNEDLLQIKKNLYQKIIKFYDKDNNGFKYNIEENHFNKDYKALEENTIIIYLMIDLHQKNIRILDESEITCYIITIENILKNWDEREGITSFFYNTWIKIDKKADVAKYHDLLLALLKLYQITLDKKYLIYSDKILNFINENFLDNKSKLFFSDKKDYQIDSEKNISWATIKHILVMLELKRISLFIRDSNKINEVDSLSEFTNSLINNEFNIEEYDYNYLNSIKQKLKLGLGYRQGTVKNNRIFKLYNNAIIGLAVIKYLDEIYMWRDKSRDVFRDLDDVEKFIDTLWDNIGGGFNQEFNDNIENIDKKINKNKNVSANSVAAIFLISYLKRIFDINYNNDKILTNFENIYRLHKLDVTINKIVTAEECLWFKDLSENWECPKDNKRELHPIYLAYYAIEFYDKLVKDYNNKIIFMRKKMEEYMYRQVFISYTGTDGKKIGQIAKNLEVIGYEPWFDKTEIPVTLLSDHVREAISKSKAIFFYITDHVTKDTKWMTDELEWALEMYKKRPDNFRIFAINANPNDVNNTFIKLLKEKDIFVQDAEDDLESLYKILKSLKAIDEKNNV